MNELAACSFNAPFQSCESGVVLQLADGTIQASNAAAQNILGLTLEQLQRWNAIDPPWQAIHPDGAPFPGDTHPAMVTLRTGQPCVNVVMGLYKPSGELTWLLINTTPLLTAAAKPYGVVSTFTDIKAQPRSPHPPITSPEASVAVPETAEAFFFERSLDLLSVLGFDGYFKCVNPMFTQTLGYAATESLTRPFLDFVHPDDHAATEAEMAKLKMGVPTFAFRNRYRTQDGHYRWLTWTASPQIEQGVIYCVARDVTQQTEMEAALRASEERWQLALRGSNDGIWDWNVQTNTVFFSTRWKTMLGYEEHEISNHLDEWANRVHPDDRAWVMQAVQDHFEQKTPFYVTEHRMQCKDGTYKWVLDRGQAVWDDTGAVLRMVGSHTDITERRALAAALQRVNQELEQRVVERTTQLAEANAALRESEDRNQLAMAVARMFTFEWEPATDIVKRSPHCAAILGLPATEAEQDTGAKFFQHIHPDDRDRFVADLQALTPANSTYKVTYRMICPDGRMVFLEESGRALFNAEGQFIRLIGMTADITDRQQMEAELEANRAILQRQLAEIETIYQSAPIGLNVLDTDLRFVRINQRLAEINGFSVADHLGKTVRELLPELADAAEQVLRPILETGEPLLNVEIRGSTPAQPGVERVWLESFLPLKDGDRVIGINTVCEEITERIQVEAALRQSEERFRTMADNAPVMVWVTDATGGCTYLSQSWYEFTGQTAATGLGLGWLEAVHPEDRATASDIFLNANKDHTAFRLEYRLRRQDGEYRWAIDAASPWFGADGQYQGYIGSVIDITDRKQSEQQLCESEERLRLGMQVAGFALAKVNYGANRVELSPAAAQVYGFSPDTLVVLREQIHATFHPDDRAQLAQLIQQVLDPSGSGWFTLDHRVVWQTGEVRWLTVRKQVFFDRSREPAKPTHAILVALDITDRKQAEESLRASEDRLRMAIASAQLGIWDWQITTNELQWDAGCCAMFGLSPDAAINIDVFLSCLHPDDRDRIQAIIQASLDPTSGGAFDTEYRVIGIQDRVERWLRSKGQVYYDATGNPLRFSGTVLNITAQKQIEAQRERLLKQEQAAREAAERANRMKDEFLAVLSHELRTPLNPILGWAKLLQVQSGNAEKLQQGLSTIERNAKLQAQLIEDLLDTSRIIRGKMTLNFAPVILSALITAALETVRLAIEAKAIQLEVCLAPTVGAVKGDASRLQQVIWNLLSNAIKFTPTGGKISVKLLVISHSSSVIGHASSEESETLEHRETSDPDISKTENSINTDNATTTNAKEQMTNKRTQITNENKEQVTNDKRPMTNDKEQVTNYAQITVTDTGKGIHPDFLPHVFELFRQQDSSTTRSFGGLGLGLAIARQVVEAHGGTITAASAGEGQGATFTVQLPLLSVASHDVASGKRDRPLNLAQRRVIVVDDERDSLELVRVVLEQEGATVRTVTAATAALQRLRQEHFDLLISDIGMPVMDGYTFIRQVRALPPQGNRDIPAIALTAYAGEANRQEILAAGFQAHQEKPIDPQQLLMAITAILTN